MKGHRRRAFTLIEILVTVAILGFLAILILPAVQQARESSRRLQCVANLKQLVLAVQNYESSFGVVPPAGLYGFSAYARLLPYLEQGSYSNALNFSLTPEVEPNQSIGSTSLGLLVCPSNQNTEAPWTSYATNIGRGLQLYGDDGAFFVVGNQVRYSSYGDGLSNTAAFAEWASNSTENRPIHFAATYSIVGMDGIGSADNFPRLVEACNGINTGSAPLFSAKGYRWINGSPGATLYNHALPVNGNSCAIGESVERGIWTAGSYHPGGANVAMSDGRVRFVSETISLAVWTALGSRNGSEIIPEF